MKISAPGLKRRTRANGTVAYYWVASAVSRDAGEYPVKTVPLHYDSDEARAIRCNSLTAELKLWLARRGVRSVTTFNGTIRDLIRLYQNLDTSPYFGVKEITRRDYDYRLRLIDEHLGEVSVAGLTAADFTRWHRNFRQPSKATGGKPRVRLAHGLMVMVRIIVGFGKSMKLPACREAVEVLEEMRFETPARRKEAVSFEQAERIVDLALAAGRRSLALGQALQFELGMRQVDVIGKWETIQPGEEGGIVYRGARWGGGLQWSDVSDDLTLSKITTKTGATGEWDLKECPLVMRVLAHYPAEDRFGPMVLSEKTGIPYDNFDYAHDWRPFATKAGVPKTVWNRDTRAGGITEGWDAEANQSDLQRFATHTQPTMTQRYARNSLASSRRVAKARVASRKQAKNEV